MTICLYSGTPGSGKSLHLASDVRFALDRRRPRPVITNFPIREGSVRHPEWHTYAPNADLTPRWLAGFADEYWETSGRRFAEDHILLGIDEVQLLHNSRNWAKDRHRMEWLEFYSQHRKYGYRIVLVAQAAKMVDNQFRMLLETECNHRRMSTFGTLGWLLALPFGGNVFLHYYTSFQTHQRLGRELHVGHAADMRLYDTHARFGATG